MIKFERQGLCNVGIGQHLLNLQVFCDFEQLDRFLGGPRTLVTCQLLEFL